MPFGQATSAQLINHTRVRQWLTDEQNSALAEQKSKPILKPKTYFCGEHTKAFFESLIPAIFLHRLSYIVALLLVDLLLYVMSDELIQIIPSEVHFVEELRRSKRGSIFRVMVRGRHCAMKVYHYLAPSPYDSPNYDINTFHCETNAYRRLKAKGFCRRGVVPDFYGVIESIKPREWKPHLDMFLDDSWSPNAILIEYIADMHKMDLSTFSKSRLASLRAILEQFQEAKVLHGDAEPRNMMVVSGKLDRVLWIDFDSAQTFPENKLLTQRQQEWMKSEIQRMDYFVYGLVQDYAEGKLNRVWHYYYDSIRDDVGEHWAEYQDYLDKNHNKVTQDADPIKEGLVPAVHEGDR